MVSGLLIFLIVANAYILLVYLAARSGLLARFNIGLLGPLLMFRTERGKRWIDWLAKAGRLWIALGSMGVVVTLAFMLLFTVYLVWQVPVLFRIPVELAPTASEIFVIPGINPFIPLGYGLVSLIVAVVVHEFSHGVAARVEGMRVKSLGVLFLIVPVGAFVEPDEDDLKASRRSSRMRVFAAGVTSNLLTALVLGIVFSAGLAAALEPKAEGVPVVREVEHSPAAGAGIREGWVLTSINGTSFDSYAGFQGAMADLRPGQRVNVTGVVEDGTRTVTLCLASREQFNGTDPGPGFDFCRLEGSAGNGTGNATREAFLGIEPLPFSPSGFQEFLTHPLSSARSFATFMALPLLRLSPVDGPLAALYETPWHDNVLGDNGYWILTNTVYWVFWISLLLGLFNALPAVPLDGGHLFRDAADGALKRAAPGMGASARERTVKVLSIVFTLLIVTLILLHIFAPRIGALF